MWGVSNSHNKKKGAGYVDRRCGVSGCSGYGYGDG
jgi:hypothetical protein